MVTALVGGKWQRLQRGVCGLGCAAWGVRPEVCGLGCGPRCVAWQPYYGNPPENSAHFGEKST